MDGWIGRLHCRYRVVSENNSHVARSRLDRVARDNLSQAWAKALDSALGDDPTVYVLRRVKYQMLLNNRSDMSDVQLARRWGERLSGAVVQTITSDLNDGANLVKFDDQADFVTHFVIDLLRGRAWECWYYGAFTSLRPLGLSAALHTVLQDNREYLPIILGRLYKAGMLESLLTALENASLDLLWRQPAGSSAAVSFEATRPLFDGALRLVDRLGWWKPGRPELNALFDSYARTAPLADWRSGEGLAAAVFQILRFFHEQGYLRPVQNPRDNGYLRDFDRALGDFDWLDTSWLRRAWLDFIENQQGPLLPVRPMNQIPTSRYAELLNNLHHVMKDGTLQMDRSAFDNPANALRLYARLINRFPRWDGDPLATLLIQQLLQTCQSIARSISPAEILCSLRQGDVEAAIQHLSGEGPAAEALQVLRNSGQLALPLIEELLASPATDFDEQNGLETSCAGLFLLLRAIQDVRLMGIARQLGYPSSAILKDDEAWLLPLSMRWAGLPGIEPLDTGLSVLRTVGNPSEGIPSEETLSLLAALREAWSGIPAMEHHRFQEHLLNIIGSQRVLDGAVLYLYLIPLDRGGMALVAGGNAGNSQKTHLWPLCGLFEDDLSQTTSETTNELVVRLLTQWLSAWEEATGQRPDLIYADESLRSVLTDKRYIVLEDLENITFVAETSKAEAPPYDVNFDGASAGMHVVGAEHREGKKQLMEALSAIESGLIGIPEADLIIGLMAMLLLRVWARWLRQFSDSSVPYLLKNFIRRPGRLFVNGDEILVVLEPQPLDIVLTMAGYLSAIEQVPFLNNRRVRFHLL
ncbi:MAG TPA: hypothetical protein VGB67_16850 [Fibrella sp.]|jgi:hypothetical protein